MVGVVHRLQGRFTSSDPDQVRDLVHRCHDHVDDARIRAYVPLLVERAARDSLEDCEPEPAIGPASTPPSR